MKKISVVLCFFLLYFNGLGQKKLLALPELNGYKTLACDFHQHTIFSDGDVWPEVRLDEAESRGLDAIAITDHIEYQPKKDWVSKDLNAAWLILNKEAEKRGIILIHGAEITRKLPPGHFNTLFISDAEKLKDTSFMNVMEEAVHQDAFIQWNHPGWKGQQPDGIPRLDSIHRLLLNKGWIKAIEVVNDNEFYPDVVNWCIEKKVAITGNSDIHGSMADGLLTMNIKHLPVTFVFAKEQSPESIRQALLEQRTMVWYQDTLIGRKDLAEEFFLRSVELVKNQFKDEKYQYFFLKNHTDLYYELRITVPGKKPVIVKLPAQSQSKFRLPVQTEFPLEVTVVNVVTGKNEFLKTELKIGD